MGDWDVDADHWAYQVVRDTVGGAGMDVASARAEGTIRIHGRVFDVLPAATGLPRDVRRLRPRISRNTIVVARRLTENARSMVDEADGNWVDLAGARISTADGLAVVVDRPKGRSVAPRATALSGAALDVAERLLVTSEVETLSAIAASTGISGQRVSQILQAFDTTGFTERAGGRRGRTVRRLVHLDLLLEAWSDTVVEQARPTIMGHATIRDPDALIEKIVARVSDLKFQYRLTGWAGIARSAPFLTATPTVHLYVPEEQFAAGSELVRGVGLVPVDEGGVVTIWPASKVTFTPPADGPVVHAARLIADLRRLGGRGVDAAAHVKEELFDVS